MIWFPDPRTIPWTMRHEVVFDEDDKPTTCWGDRDENNSRCYAPGTERLGLCKEHELQILGAPAQ